MEKIDHHYVNKCTSYLDAIETLTKEQKSYSKQFRNISYLSAVSISLGILGTIFPYGTIYSFHYILMTITVLVSLITVYLSSKFFISISHFENLILRDE